MNMNNPFIFVIGFICIILSASVGIGLLVYLCVLAGVYSLFVLFPAVLYIDYKFIMYMCKE